MSEAQTAAATQPAAPATLTVSQAAQKLAERRVESNLPNPSDAGRALAQHRERARQERQAQAQADVSQNVSEESEEDQHVEGADPAQVGETGNGEAEPNEPANSDNAATEGDSDDSQTIDLGEGVSVTLAEVRDNFMFKADYHRKTEAVANERKALAQTTAALDHALKELVPVANQHKGKTRADFIHEFGPVEGLDKWDEHQALVGRMTALARQASEAEFIRALDARDQYLAEHYNKAWADPKKQDEAYTKITGYALKQGIPPEVLKNLTDPWAIVVLDKAMRLDEIEAGKSKIQTVIASKPKVVRPGAKVSAQAQNQSAVKAAHAKAKASGKLADAVAYMQTKRKATAG